MKISALQAFRIQRSLGVAKSIVKKSLLTSEVALKVWDTIFLGPLIVCTNHLPIHSPERATFHKRWTSSILKTHLSPPKALKGRHFTNDRHRPSLRLTSHLQGLNGRNPKALNGKKQCVLQDKNKCSKSKNFSP